MRSQAIYHQKRQIPGFTIEAITDDTWFINRDDNHRIAIIVSLRLINKSGSPIRIQRCKLSGYSPKIPPEELVLDGYDKTIGLEYPKYDPFEPGAGVHRQPPTPSSRCGSSLSQVQ